MTNRGLEVFSNWVLLNSGCAFFFFSQWLDLSNAIEAAGVSLTLFSLPLIAHAFCTVGLWLFSHESKSAQFEFEFELHNLNDHSNTQNYIAMRNLNDHSNDSILDCVYTKLHRDVWFELGISNYALRCNLWICVHTVQNTVIRMIIWIAQFNLKFKLRTFALMWKQSVSQTHGNACQCKKHGLLAEVKTRSSYPTPPPPTPHPLPQ